VLGEFAELFLYSRQQDTVFGKRTRKISHEMSEFENAKSLYIKPDHGYFHYCQHRDDNGMHACRDMLKRNA